VKTDHLTNVLFNDDPPCRRLWSSLVAGAAAGTGVAAAHFSAGIGFRPDSAEAIHSMRLMFKFVVTTSLAATAVPVTFKLSWPGENLGLSSALRLAPILLACALGIELSVVLLPLPSCALQSLNSPEIPSL
jgi:hypothetical protein